MSMRILAVLTLALVVLSCAPMKYVPVESVRTECIKADTTGMYERMLRFFESQHLKETSSDSVIDRTKETVVIKDNGDTARYDKERIVYVSSRREKELEHKVQQQDSIIEDLYIQLASVKTDSIPVPYPVERSLSRWEQAKMDFGGMAMGTVAGAVCMAVVWIILRFKRRKS